MNLAGLTYANACAYAKVEKFRRGTRPEEYGVITQRFHRYKNTYPYFGFLDITIEDVAFVMFSANDDLIAMPYFWYGPSAFEPMSMKTWLKSCVDVHIVYDIGAFSGIYSLAAAACNPSLRKIYAFEPVRRTYGRLLLNVQANGFGGMIVTVNKGVAGQNGEVAINQFRGENVLGNGASILPKDIPVTANDERVELVKLDDHIRSCGEPPDLIKIDVEGAELLVLEGACQMLANYKPRILIEVTPTTAEQVGQELKSLGYAVHLIHERQRRIEPFSGGCPCVANLFAAPS
jgi:FkbM family methyltransferase